MQRVQLTTLAGQNIAAAPLLVDTFTATADAELLVQLYLSGIAGAGNYRMTQTKRLGGVGSIYQGATIPLGVAPTITTGWFAGLPIPVRTGDVLRSYVQGLAADVAVGVVVETFDVTAAAVSDLCSVWSCPSRTLTQSAAQTSACISGSDISILRGDTWQQTFSRLGNLTGWDKIWFTVKDEFADLDPAAQVKVEVSAPPAATDGLVAIAGAAVAPPGNLNASITMVNVLTGEILVRIEAVETAKLGATRKLWYDVQWYDGTNTLTVLKARCLIESDVTRVVS